MNSPYRRPGGSSVGLVIVLTLALVVPRAAAAQEEPIDSVSTAEAEIADRCRGDEHRQFDFWLGSWEVRNAEGEVIGENEIRRIARGCGLLESWQGATGGRGLSLNTYDAARGKWTQRWVGAGTTLWLEGGLDDGNMVLAGMPPRASQQGAVLDRITWTPLPDGRVRQVWEVSPEAEEGWREVFRGFYERVEGEASQTEAAAPARQPPSEEVLIIRDSAALSWHEAPSGAAFAPIQGRARDEGPFTFRMRMPARWEMQPHVHDAIEHITVVSGTLQMKFSPDGEPAELPAGSVVVVPAGRPMWAWTGAEPTEIQVHGTGPFNTRPIEGNHIPE